MFSFSVVAAVVLVSPSPSGTSSPATPAAHAVPQRTVAKPVCTFTRKKISAHRRAVWGFERELGLARTRVSSVPVVGCRYARWVEGRWWERRVGLWRDVRDRRVVAGRLDRYLAGTPMAGLGRVLERVGRQHGVSPFFIVGVAGKESSLGAAACSANPRNVWGLGACGRAWSPPYFGSWESAIDWFARFVEGKTSVSRGWPSARTPWDYHGYCAGCEASWASGVTRFMSAMGAGTSVEYRP